MNLQVSPLAPEYAPRFRARVLLGVVSLLSILTYIGSASTELVVANLGLVIFSFVVVFKPRWSFRYAIPHLLLFLISLVLLLRFSQGDYLANELALYAFVCALLFHRFIGATMLAIMFFALFFVAHEAQLTELLAAALTSLAIYGLASYLRARLLTNERTLNRAQESEILLACKNCRAFEVDLERFFQLNKRYEIPCTVVKLSLNFDRKLNIKESQEVQEKLVEIWVTRVRQTDEVYKVNDQAFACLLPATTAENAGVLAKDIQRATLAYALPFEVDVALDVCVVSANPFSQCEDWLAQLYKG